jgi:RNA polymerase sigma-70 factor, ECF subfamily
VTSAGKEASPCGSSRAFEDDDAAWVTRCRKGDVHAFEVLVERYQGKMINVSFRILGDYADACDAVQESFLAAYRSLSTFRGDARFSTWLYAIVLNQSRNRLRQKAARSRREVASIDDPLRAREGAVIGARPPDGGSAVDQLHRRERDRKIQECIDAMDEEQREVLVLRDIEGLTYEEIGEALHLPDGTVKSRLFRARTALKDSLKRALGDLR